MDYKKILLFLFLFYSSVIYAQSYYLDDNGVIREATNGTEVSFYGVNYTLPFAHAYRMCKRLGVNPKKRLIKMYIISPDWVLMLIVYMYGTSKFLIRMEI